MQGTPEDPHRDATFVWPDGAIRPTGDGTSAGSEAAHVQMELFDSAACPASELGSRGDRPGAPCGEDVSHTGSRVPVSDADEWLTGRWIHTVSGRRVYPLSPDPDTIDIEDIAYALSHLCRFTGHTSRFYSVGEHSLRVCRIVESRDPAIRMAALLHDASEAYLNDIASPVKRHPQFQFYREAEARLTECIYAYAGIPGAWAHAPPASVHAADHELLCAERAELMTIPPPRVSWMWQPTPWEVRVDFLGTFRMLFVQLHGRDYRDPD